jgi:hypothetical protein
MRGRLPGGCGERQGRREKKREDNKGRDRVKRE